LGASTIANLDRMGFAGEIHLVNPNRNRIAERPCLKSVDDLPLGVDVAVLAIPRAAVLDTVKALARRQVGAAIIFPLVLPRAANKAATNNATLPVLPPGTAWSSRVRTVWVS